MKHLKFPLIRMLFPTRDMILCVLMGMIMMGMQGCIDNSSTGNPLLSQLDEAIDNRENYHNDKEKKLQQLREEIAEADGEEERFHAIGHLLDEYKSYNTDSALSLCRRRLAYAEKHANPRLMIHARLSMADVLSYTGLYKEAFDIIESIPRDSIPEYLIPFYYHINRTINGFMADFNVSPEGKKKYADVTDAYRDSIIMLNEPGSFYNILSRCDQLNVKGKPKEALRLMEEYFAANDPDDHEKAIAAYTLSESFRLLGNKAKEKEQLIISSIHDMKTGVNEYVSLRKLALLLYNEGDVNRAYRYLNICMEDAQECNARLRIIEINNIFPVVNAVYLDTIATQQRRLRWGMVLVGILSLLVMVTAYYIYKEKKKVDKARQELDFANLELNEANQELKKANKNLSEAKDSIAEQSILKEEYIAQYMSQCTAYIEKLDKYQNTLSRIVTTKQYGELKKMLKNFPTSETEAKEFFANFDGTFLKLFPSFVTDFNALLRPEEAIIPKTLGRLNTELRIFALIRLGVTDSVQIAHFLRYTPTTIYNYRARVRNKALGDRNALETKMMNIGKFI